MTKSMTFCLLLAALAGTVPASAAGDNPVEIGSVHWGRDLGAALETSAGTGRPVLVLFQEVPGCSGCRTFGGTVLTEPLLVEAMEDDFVPVFIYNNRGGEDSKILERFGEPAWNFQVIRFLDVDGRDIIPRRDGVWSVAGVARRMVDALEAADRPAPKYLRAVAAGFDTADHGVSAFAVHCFWAGEVALGRIDGVVETEAGWIDRREVTRVVYDRRKLSAQSLAEMAREADSALEVYLPGDEAGRLKGIDAEPLDGRYSKAPVPDQKKQLQQWPAIREVPGLTEMQLTKINAFLPAGRAAALAWLSPRQRRALEMAE